MGTLRTVGACLGACLVVVLATACDKSGAEARPSAAAELADVADPADLAALARLMPADAAAVIVLPSIDAADAALDDLGRIIGQSLPPIIDAFMDAAPDFPLSYVDTTRPLLVAVQPGPPLNMPAPAFILPVSDPAAVAELLQDYTVYIEGAYVGYSSNPDYTLSDTPGPLTESLPAGPFAVRADLDALLTPLRPMAEGMLPAFVSQIPQQAETPGIDMAEMFRSYLSMLFEGVAATELFELVLDVRGDDLIISGQIDVAEDSMLANIPPASCDSLDDMVAWLDGDASVQMVLAMDARAVTHLTKSWMLDLQGVYPNVDEDQWMEYMATLQVLSARCGHVFAGDGNFSATGMNFNYLIEAEDPDGFVRLMTQAMKEGLEVVGGLQVEFTESTVDGRPSTELTMDMNALLEAAANPSLSAEAQDTLLKNIYGGDGIMSYRTTAVDGHVLLTGGSGPLTDSERTEHSRGNPPAELVQALAGLKDTDTRMALRIDYATFVLQMAEMMAEMPGGEDVRPPQIDGTIPWTFWAGGKGTRWTFGSNLDLAGMVTAVQSMAPR